MNSLMDLSNISVAKAVELEQIRRFFCSSRKAKSEHESKREIKYEFASNFSDGKSDGENNFEPIAHQWFNSDYRQGYLIGMAKRINANAKYFNVEVK